MKKPQRVNFKPSTNMLLNKRPFNCKKNGMQKISPGNFGLLIGAVPIGLTPKTCFRIEVEFFFLASLSSFLFAPSYRAIPGISAQQLKKMVKNATAGADIHEILKGFPDVSAGEALLSPQQVMKNNTRVRVCIFGASIISTFSRRSLSY